MNIGAIRGLYDAAPFRPFLIHLADGREILVPHRDLLFLPPGGRLLIVYPPDDAFHIVDTLLVTDLEVKASPQPPASSNGGPA